VLAESTYKAIRPTWDVQISYDASEGGEFAQIGRVTSYWEGGWPNRHMTFIVAEKA